MKTQSSNQNNRAPVVSLKSSNTPPPVLLTYTLQQYAGIAANGFNYTIPPATVDLISKLAMEVGSPTYIKTPVFQQKRQPEQPIRKKQVTHTHEEEDWTTIRSFHVTKIEKKEGVDGLINKIQLQLNKALDTNKVETNKNIVELLDELIQMEASKEDMEKVGNAFFNIASTNRFYSMLYAELYSRLIEKYDILKEAFQTNFSTFTGLFQKIECGDPDKNYSEFCDFIKVNEKRRALSLFFVNLSKIGVLPKSLLLETLKVLMEQIYELIHTPNKQNEVNELSEIIDIFYSEELVLNAGPESDVSGMSIKQIIHTVATSKPKTYVSLPSKAKFKFMDIIEGITKK